MQDLQQERVHFHNLDVLRFIAAFMIVIFHGYLGYNDWFGIPKPLQGETEKTLNHTGEILSNLNSNLSWGVDYFFIISGFLITYLLLSEKMKSGKIRIGSFYLRRILRIWPVYIFIVILSKWWYVFLYEPRPDYFWTVTFLNNFEIIFTGKSQFPFQHFWSVCVEEHFYLFWPLIIGFVPVKHLPKIFLSIIVLSLGFRSYMYFTSENWPHQVSYNTLSNMDTLAIGSWLGFAHFNKPLNIKLPAWLRITVYVGTLTLFCLVNPSTGNNYYHAAFEKYIYHALFIFWFLNYMFNEKAFLAFKKKNLFHYFGKISYGLYMYHNILIVYIVKMIIWQIDVRSFWLYWGIFIVMTFGVSVLSYELVEKHLLKLKERFAYIKTLR